ncbi:MAG: hypothetical protein DHS20C05_19050 [Hyphococcus sp.]|nr:MAG: hypothetical protein DHS20C05_19050 [Marinicaulis sp.]
MTDFIIASHWREIELQAWLARWPNFHPREIASKDSGAVKISTDFMDGLQATRRDFKKPMKMTSVYRTPEHNRRVGGVPGSQHVAGLAGDCALAVLSDGPVLEALARKHGMTGIGRYPKQKFIHMDMRPGRLATWGRW